MNSLERSLQADTSKYERVVPPETPTASEPTRALLPQRDVYERSPVPVINGTFPSQDALRSFHIGGTVPQTRAPMPAPASAQGAGATSTTSIVATSTSSTITNNPPTAISVTVTTPPLNMGDTFQSTVTMAKAFQLQKVATATPVRVELYKTAAAQAADIFRAATTPVGLGTEQGIITDIYLDTTPVVWDVTPDVTGHNGDSPATSTIYITITNLGTAGSVAMVTLTYVPLQS
jgi:hypothetical protein